MASATCLAPLAPRRFFERFRDVIALMVKRISGVGQGMVWLVLYLLAIWYGSSESFDAGHVRYQVVPFVLAFSKAVAADIQTC